MSLPWSIARQTCSACLREARQLRTVVLPPRQGWLAPGRAFSTTTMLQTSQTSHLPSADSPTSWESYATPVLPLPRHIPSSSGLLLLSVPGPASKWPSHVEMEDKLVSELTKVGKKVGVRVICEVGQNRYNARLISADGRTSDLGKLLIETITSSDFLETLGTALQSSGALPASPEILVCTHGARDCRCGDIGGDLVEALKKETGRRKATVVTVSEVSHVGGHKWAANAILLPSLHLVGNLRPSHAPALLDHLVFLSSAPAIEPSLGDTSVALDARSQAARGMWDHFRGAFGKEEEDQEALWVEATTPVESMEEQESAVIPEDEVVGGYVAAATTSADDHSRPISLLRPTPQEKVRLRFIRMVDGETRTTDVDAFTAETVMDVAKREGLEPIEGVCGGHLECATCHIYLPASAPQSEVTDDEEDMLGYALEYKEDESRLACQIEVSKELADWSREEGNGIGLPRW